MTLLDIACTTMFLLAGIAAGQIYFAAMRRSLGALVAGSRLGPLLLTLGRFAGIAFFLLAAARIGVLSLLGAFLGFLIARSSALRAAEKSA